MRASTYPIMLLLSILTLSSCKKDDNPANPSPTSQEILPLKAGNTWVFRVTGFDTTGTVTGTGGSFSIVIGKDTVIGNDTWHQFQSNNSFLTNKPDGVWLMQTGASPVAPALYYKYPANVGDSLSWSTFQVSVYSNNISVTVPLGTYSCYQYRNTYNSISIEDDYLAPGIGFIAIDSYSITASGREYCAAKLSLVSVTIK